MEATPNVVALAQVETAADQKQENKEAVDRPSSAVKKILVLDHPILERFVPFLISYALNGFLLILSSYFQCSRFQKYIQSSLVFEPVIEIATVCIPLAATRSILRIQLESRIYTSTQDQWISFSNLIIQMQIPLMILGLLVGLVFGTIIKGPDGVVVISSEFAVSFYLRLIVSALGNALFEVDNIIHTVNNRVIFTASRQILLNILQFLLEAILYGYVDFMSNNWVTGIASILISFLSIGWISLIRSNKSIMDVKLQNSYMNLKTAFARGAVLKDTYKQYLKCLHLVLLQIISESIFPAFVAFGSAKTVVIEDVQAIFFFYIALKPLRATYSAFFEGLASIVPQQLRQGTFTANISLVFKEAAICIVYVCLFGFVLMGLITPEVLYGFKAVTSFQDMLLAVIASGLLFIDSLFTLFISYYQEFVLQFLLILGKILLYTLIKGRPVQAMMMTQLCGSILSLLSCILIFGFRISRSQKKKKKQIGDKIPFDEDMLVED